MGSRSEPSSSPRSSDLRRLRRHRERRVADVRRRVDAVGHHDLDQCLGGAGQRGAVDLHLPPAQVHRQRQPALPAVDRVVHLRGERVAVGVARRPGDDVRTGAAPALPAVGCRDLHGRYVRADRHRRQELTLAEDRDPRGARPGTASTRGSDRGYGRGRRSSRAPRTGARRASRRRRSGARCGTDRCLRGRYSLLGLRLHPERARQLDRTAVDPAAHEQVRCRSGHCARHRR